MESEGFYRKHCAEAGNKEGGHFHSNTLSLSITNPFSSTIHLTQTGSQVQIYVVHYKNKSKVHAKWKLMKAPIKAFFCLSESVEFLMKCAPTGPDKEA